MTEKKKPIPEDDPKQSAAFREAVRELEAAGELDIQKGSTNFENAVQEILSNIPRRSP